MKKILLFSFYCFCLSAFCSDFQDSKQELRTNKAIQKAIEQEKKFAKEQKFYKYGDYDFKSSEVNEDSLKNIPEIKPEDDFDMTHVYD